MLQPLDLADAFACAIADARYENLSPAAIDTAKKSLLDTLGVIIAASGMESAVRPFVDLARQCGGKPESTLLGFGGRLPAPMAALANGAMAHCLDFDDRTSWGAHSGSSLVPAALAVAERRGGVSGRGLITAVAAAQDMFIRLRCNVGAGQDWNLSTVIGVFSATAAAAHVLGLGERQIANALGIASMQASGTMQLVYGGGPLRGMYAGFSAQSAVMAALLAESGLGGIDGAFEGKAGLLHAYFANGHNRAAMLHDIGLKSLGPSMVYKPWPVVGLAHTYIHATVELVRHHAIVPTEIEQIRVFASENQKEMCTPVDRRRTPRTAADAKFSLPFCVALAALKGEIRIKDFSPAALKDPSTLAMVQKIAIIEDGSEELRAKAPIGRVEIVMRDGRRFERRGDKVPGSPEAPINWHDLATKFRDCAAAAASPVSGARVEAVLDQFAALETVDDATAVIRQLVA